MSGSTKAGLLPRFSPAATQATVDASTDTYPADYITNIILEISGYLINLVEHTELLGRAGTDPYSPSLRTLHSRLHNGQLNPSPIQSHANEHARIKVTLGQRTAKDAAHRPLEDFEDLYYAVLARMQDIHHILNARLGSGFSTVTDLVHTDGPSIADLYVSLAQYWNVLNHTAFVKAIDSAVRRSRVKCLHQEIIAQVHNDEITQADAEELLSDLYDPSEYDGIQGLAWVSGWAPSMIAAWLEEKYRIVLNIEKEDAEHKSRMDRKRAKMGKKVKQPQHELRSKKEGKKVFDEMQMAGGKNQMATQNDQYAQKQTKKGHWNIQEDLNSALEWQVKTQRVSEYTRYLRSMASHDAKYVVASTACNNDMRMSGFGGPVQHIDNEDIDMTGTGF
jgi:hypothetical protein